MLVDDEELVLQSTERILQSCGHQVSSFGSASEALEDLQHEDNVYDCLVVDVSMPVMSGIEMAEVVLKIRPGTPIVLISGYNDQSLNSDMLKVQGVEFLLKPFNSEAINEAITRAMSNARLEPQVELHGNLNEKPR